MKKISICNFKGIHGPLEVDFTEIPNDDSRTDITERELNLLLYAENGGGKTSIAEGIRAAIFAPEIHGRVIPSNAVGQGRKEAIKSLWRPMLHDRSTDLFTIKIDNGTFTSDATNTIPTHKAAILCRKDLLPTPRIDFNQLVNAENVKFDQPLGNLITDDNIDLVIDEANLMLQSIFKEDIQLVRLQENGIFIGIVGILPETQHIGDRIHLMVNEARQNIVKIVLFFSFLKLVRPSAAGEEKMLVVLDDIMSSLDLANRIILARYIIEMGKEYQMLVMTHNAGFYNLVRHVAGVEGEADNWKYCSLYCDEVLHSLYVPERQEDVKAIIKRAGGSIKPDNDTAINALRKRLEYLLREFSKILVMGIQEETKDLIEKIATDKSTFCIAEGDSIKSLSNLISEIESLVDNVPEGGNLKEKIKNKIEKYRNESVMPMVAETIRHLHVYQKVILHPGSHDQSGDIVPTSQREITLTIDLIRKLETIIKRPSASYPYFL